jgi:hypothetical protein
MRESLKQIFSNQITLEDSTRFYYTITPYELKNSLGNVVAMLQEYDFTKKEDTSTPFNFKLYKTKEGNWYDIEEAGTITEKTTLRMLKSAIDSKENDTVLQQPAD